jgi:hypothetical protein
MSLLQIFAKMWARLAPAGWEELMAAHGARLPNASADGAAWAASLSTDLLKIDRKLVGFRDFAPQGRRLIEPGRPGESLLYHALASPAVTQTPRGQPLGAFAMPAELEAVENYVFAVRQATLDSIQAQARELAGPNATVDLAVFASEYRTAEDTGHRRHADLCYSRTGIARIGTDEPHYDPRARGFVHLRPDDDAFTIRATPSRFSVYLAVAVKGDPERFGITDFNAYVKAIQKRIEDKKLKNPDLAPTIQPRDDSENVFWVPLHKVFSGSECLLKDGRPLPIHVQLSHRHVNQKLKRLFQALGAQSEFGQDYDLTQPPFMVTEGLAAWSDRAEWGSGLLMPQPRERLVEPAVLDGEVLSMWVPPATAEDQPRRFGALRTTEVVVPRRVGSFRRSPGYVHIRSQVVDGVEVDLNDACPNPLQLIGALTAGDYRAVSYSDPTADGWVEAFCPELAGSVHIRKPAYSLLAAPDFFPAVSQRTLFDWHESQNTVWFAPPLPLSACRVAANLQLTGAGFEPDDTTVTAVINAAASSQAPSDSNTEDSIDSARISSLPDDAAGIFAPGWDIGQVFDGVREHFSSHTLGSPFPEDVKLCAAISAYWPAVVPDAARVYPVIAPDPGNPEGPPRLLPYFPTVVPMTDREIGQEGDLPWDGINGPALTIDAVKSTVRFVSPYHADYVRQALNRRFSLKLTSQIDVPQYEARIRAMNLVYAHLPPPDLSSYSPPLQQQITNDPLMQRACWQVGSFTEVAADDADWTALIQSVRKAKSSSLMYRFLMYQPGAVQPLPARPVQFEVTVLNNQLLTFIVTDAALYTSADRGLTWQAFDA